MLFFLLSNIIVCKGNLNILHASNLQQRSKSKKPLLSLYINVWLLKFFFLIFKIHNKRFAATLTETPTHSDMLHGVLSCSCWMLYNGNAFCSWSSGRTLRRVVSLRHLSARASNLGRCILLVHRQMACAYSTLYNGSNQSPQKFGADDLSLSMQRKFDDMKEDCCMCIKKKEKKPCAVWLLKSLGFD